MEISLKDIKGWCLFTVVGSNLQNVWVSLSWYFLPGSIIQIHLIAAVNGLQRPRFHRNPRWWVWKKKKIRLAGAPLQFLKRTRPPLFTISCSWGRPCSPLSVTAHCTFHACHIRQPSSEYIIIWNSQLLATWTLSHSVTRKLRLRFSSSVLYNSLCTCEPNWKCHYLLCHAKINKQNILKKQTENFISDQVKNRTTAWHWIGCPSPDFPQ